MRYMVGRVYRHHPHEMVWLESTPHPWDALVCVLPGYDMPVLSVLLIVLHALPVLARNGMSTYHCTY